MSTYYLYAGILHPEFGIVDLALVGTYNTEERAMDQKRLEEMCYSDDGLQYAVRDTPVSPVPNCEYDDLIKRVSK